MQIDKMQIDKMQIDKLLHYKFIIVSKLLA
jgi:hypothetical protein